MPLTPPPKTFFSGNNLDVPRNDIADESFGLVSLDPPFSSNAKSSKIFTRYKARASG